MDRWIGRVSLVTGASAGVGASIAKSLVQNGMKVIGVSRNPEKIQVSKKIYTDSSLLVTISYCTPTDTFAFYERQ